jgi:replicative DNA helicase
MIDPLACDSVMVILTPSDFYDETMGIIFAAMMAIRDSAQGLDLITLRHRLSADGNDGMVGGAAKLAQLFTKVPNAAHAVYYARIVKQHSVRRMVIIAASEALDQAYDVTNGMDGSDLVTSVQNEFFGIADMCDRGGITQARIGELMPDHLDRLERLRTEDCEIGLTTGIRDMDNYIRLRDGEMSILGARPSQGKSSLGLNIASHVSCELRAPTIFMSLEMSTTELLDRFLASQTNINMVRFQTGRFSNAESQRVVHAAASTEEAPLTLVDSTTLNMAQISSIARQAYRTGNCRLLVVDYVQLIIPSTQRDTREQQVSKISRSLKRLARELQIPVMLLAQVGRGPGDGRAPNLNELRESGSLEQDADNVFFIHRPAYYRQDIEDNSDTEVAEIHIKKQRNGPTGSVSCVFHKPSCKFSQIDRHSGGASGDIDF